MTCAGAQSVTDHNQQMADTCNQMAPKQTIKEVVFLFAGLNIRFLNLDEALFH